jgi:SAM-dependent methyltransferase
MQVLHTDVRRLVPSATFNYSRRSTHSSVPPVEPNVTKDHVIDRKTSWGDGDKYSVADRFGMWLSTSKVRRHLGSFHGKDVADIGCGFDAVFVRAILDEVRSATLVDVTLAQTLKDHHKVRAIEGLLPESLAAIPNASLDFVASNNVLEHLWQPELTLREIRRTLRPGGACFFNVPSWRGKVVLEAAAFRFGMTSKAEIDDHKSYYDVRQLWELLVRGGFKPSEVQCRVHKFGLNTYAFCKIGQN